MFLDLCRIIFNRQSSRPADLPENAVNVWKLRQEIENIENGRKSIDNSTMKVANANSNGVDFVALDSILKESPAIASPMDSLNFNHFNDKDDAKSECLTAESLQEIRRRLRKLNSGFTSPSRRTSKDELSLDDDKNITNGNHHNGNHLKLSLEQNCKSLELRKNKERDINADEWLNRRKSYGFEKMHQPNEATSLAGANESSTDSGLGRSSDLSNWSPTSESQRTIITFGDKTKPTTTSISLFSNPHHVKSSDVIGNGNEKQHKPVPLRRSLEKKDELKRHSIAVDEKVDEHYQQRNGVDRKISLVNLNGPYDDKSAMQHHVINNNNSNLNDGRQKKVEFCKTEIHFAAESGRVNIVETELKPPPTNNFRRRRRNSGTVPTSSSLSTSSTAVDYLTQKLDDEVAKSMENQQHYNGTSLLESNVTTSIGSIYSSSEMRLSRDDDSEGHSDTDGLRGILKNKPIKPKPYHLGENLENGNSLWGVRLKPVENQHTTWRHSADLTDSNVTTTAAEDELEVEFKNLVKAMDHEKSDNHNNHYQSTVSSNGYSTKINLSSLSAIPQHHPATANKGERYK
jgi:hypothetical protein